MALKLDRFTGQQHQHVYLRDCPRAEECPHEFVEVFTQACGPLLYSRREFGLLHLSRTKRRNWKRKGGAIVKPRKAEAENGLYREKEFECKYTLP
ncbi:hypothetical protein RND71_036725 [Anisodus tanguticus]|uniref:Uncharacterized protein n=1 Tax=Anisodus tanguticus TaxID=243964 RepID=A0AAE1UY61_9SOLA|nr:hypothetical protein RND71_036725 [Anisodus tanguticus]